MQAFGAGSEIIDLGMLRWRGVINAFVFLGLVTLHAWFAERAGRFAKRSANLTGDRRDSRH